MFNVKEIKDLYLENYRLKKGIKEDINKWKNIKIGRNNIIKMPYYPRQFTD